MTMRAVPLVPPVPDPPRSRSRTALTIVAWLLAILFHILLLLVLWWSLRHHRVPKQPAPITVQLVPPPKPVVNRPKPKLKPVPKPKPPPAPPKPKPEPKPKPLPPPPHPHAVPKLMPLPPKIQFQKGKLAKTSHAGRPAHHAAHHAARHKVAKPAAPKLPAWLRGDVPVPPPRHHQGMTMGSRGAPGKHVREATQSERDLILSQILESWHKPPFPWGPKAVVSMRVVVLPNGYLAAPFNAKGKWDPDAAITDFKSMAPGDPRRDLLLTLYMAIRVAQPLTLPSALKAKAPFLADLDFRLSDVP